MAEVLRAVSGRRSSATSAATFAPWAQHRALDDRQLLERELAVGVAVVAERVVAGEAGVAVDLARGPDRLVDAVEREVGERVGAELGGDLRRPCARGRSSPRASTCRPRSGRGGGSAAPRSAGGPRSRRRRAACRRSGASCCRGRSSRRRRRRACRRRSPGSGLNFIRRPCLRSSWPGWMKVRCDVAVLDQAVVLGQARTRARSRSRRGCRSRGPRSRGRRRPAPRGRGSRPSCRAPPAAPGPRAASRGGRSRCARRRSGRAARPARPGGVSSPSLGQRDQLARADLAHQLGADDVEGAALRGDAAAVAELAERQRPDAVRVAEGDHGALGHHHGRVGALEARHHRGDGVLDRPLLLDREQRGDDLRVRGAAEA